MIQNPPSITSLRQCADRLRVMLRNTPELRIVAIELLLTAALSVGMADERNTLVEYARQLVRDMQEESGL
jgi:hypothetical protein